MVLLGFLRFRRLQVASKIGLGAVLSQLEANLRLLEANLRQLEANLRRVEAAEASWKRVKVEARQVEASQVAARQPASPRVSQL